MKYEFWAVIIFFPPIYLKKIDITSQMSHLLMSAAFEVHVGVQVAL
jgi:hypothetical protein